MKKLLLLLSLITSAFFFNACTSVIEHDVYVTVYPLKYIAEELLQDTDYSVGMVPGVSTHDHSAEWPAKQIIAMKNADFIFYVGANFDRYMDLKQSVFENSDVRLIKLEDQKDYISFICGVEHTHDEDDHHHHHGDDLKDPHFWISPKRMLDALELLYDLLTERYLDDASTIHQNYIEVKLKLEELDFLYTEALSDTNNRLVLTSTSLYEYLKHDYGFNYMPISDRYLEDPDQINISDQAYILETIQTNAITRILIEKYSQSPSSNHIYSVMLQNDIDANKIYFDVLAILTNENMKRGYDYYDVMLENLDFIKEAIN